MRQFERIVKMFKLVTANETEAFVAIRAAEEREAC